jgi:hypothetical protein
MAGRTVKKMDGQPNRLRTIMLRFFVTESERDMIFKKMAQIKTKNLSAYLRKMAIDGYIFIEDFASRKSIAWELHKIGGNVNQIAMRVNSTRSVYEPDIKELRNEIEQIWQLLKSKL